MRKKDNQKFGTIAILGEINVGKSTLLNQLINKEISIVTHKANTTREKIKGITSNGDTQIVIIDTPGLSATNLRTSRGFLSQVWDALIEANYLFLVVDCRKTISRTLTQFLDQLNNSTVALPDAVLVINKIDRCTKERLLIKSKEINDSFTFRKTFMISALRGYGVSDMRSWMLANMPQKSWTYPKSKRHDMTMQKFLNEKTRETILLRIHQEVPYNLEVDTYEIETLRDGNIKVWQSINVQNARHRAMLIGKSGHTIKAISSGSRLKIEKALNKKVHLFLDVKLKKRKPARMQSSEGLL